MADPKQGAKPVGAVKPGPQAAPVEIESSDAPKDPAAELAALRKENEALKGKYQRVSSALRRLAHAFLTPMDATDKGQARRNNLAQSIGALVKEFTDGEEE